MRAGRLNQRVTFQSRSLVTDEFGNEQNIWADVATVWARVEPIIGREFFAALQTTTAITTRVVVRYSSQVSGVTTKDRIQHGLNVYDIQSAINFNSRGEELHFMCTDHEG